MKGLKHLAIILTALAACSCGLFGGEDERHPKRDNVMILYSAGFNSLGPDLIEDVHELAKGELPSKNDDNVIVVVSHATEKYMLYGKATQPCVIQIYKNRHGEAVLDTLLRMDTDKLLTKSDVMKNALNYVAARFEAKKYGMIYSSHASGWLPVGYYENPDRYENPSGAAASAPRKAQAASSPEGGMIYEEFSLPGPKVKSIGQEIHREESVNYSYEMDVQTFAQSIPYHMDYIIFDACLMGCIEVAYELKDVCDRIAFSQAEVLSDGLCYTTITPHLFKKTPDVNAVAQDYYDQYASRSGDFKSATFSVVDCSKLPDLARICQSLFERYRKEIAAVDASTIQKYFRYKQHWFYDLEDILVKAGISDAEKESLSKALEAAAPYKVYTESFLPLSGGFDIKTFCGFSSYLPCQGSKFLDSAYKNLAWNQDTKFVQ